MPHAASNSAGQCVLPLSGNGNYGVNIIYGFKDALRAAGVSEDVNDALTGHAGAGSVGRTYGARDMLKRFGLPILNDAVSKVRYPGLDLSHLRS
jgi:hypothetical protein